MVGCVGGRLHSKRQAFFKQSDNEPCCTKHNRQAAVLAFAGHSVTNGKPKRCSAHLQGAGEGSRRRGRRRRRGHGCLPLRERLLQLLRAGLAWHADASEGWRTRQAAALHCAKQTGAWDAARKAGGAMEAGGVRARAGRLQEQVVIMAWQGA
jgi:hypothetical protein